MQRTTTLALLVGLTWGCANEDVVLRDRTFVDSWQQAPTDQVDILFVVDNSASMMVEQQILSAGFQAFVNSLDASAGEGEEPVDFHIGVIDTDFVYTDPDRGRLLGTPAVIGRDTPDFVEVFQERALVGTDGGGKEKGLEAAAYALSPAMTSGPNAGFLRENANLLIVFVSDEDDCSDEGALGPDAENIDCYRRREVLVPIEQYAQTFIDLKGSAGSVRTAAIVGPEEATGGCDESTLPGRRYIDVADLTGGLTASICDENWDEFLGELGLTAAGIFTTFTMTHGAKDGTLSVYVDDVLQTPIEVTRDEAIAQELSGYVYLPDAQAIEFLGDAIPPRESIVRAEYTIQPGT